MRVFTDPPLSISEAHTINVALTVGYVLPLYLTKFTRLSYSKRPAQNGSVQPNQRWRDDPVVIKARMVSVTITTILGLLYMCWKIDRTWWRLYDVRTISVAE